MATKRPFANYAGILKEVETGDLLLGGGAASPDAVRQNLQRLMLGTAVLGNYPAGIMPAGIWDVFQDESGVDLANSAATYGAEYYTTGVTVQTGSSVAGNGALYDNTMYVFPDPIPANVTVTKVGVYTGTSNANYGPIFFVARLVSGTTFYINGDASEWVPFVGPLVGTGYREWTVPDGGWLIPDDSEVYYIGYYLPIDMAYSRNTGTDGYYSCGSVGGVWDDSAVFSEVTDYDLRMLITYFDPTQNMILISDPTAIAIVPTWAMATLFVKNKDTSTKTYFSTASIPSWTELTGLTLIAANVDGTGVDQYSTGSISVSGSSDKQARWKIETDAGNDTELHGVAIRYE